MSQPNSICTLARTTHHSICSCRLWRCVGTVADIQGTGGCPSIFLTNHLHTLHYALPIHCRHCDDPVSLIKHLQYMSDITQRTFSCCSAAACITAVHRVTHRCSCRTSVSTDTQKQARLCAANLSHMHKHRPSPKHTALCRVRSWFSVPHPLQVGKRYARQL